MLSIKQPQFVEIPLENIHMIDIILSVRFSIAVLDAYYESVGFYQQINAIILIISRCVLLANFTQLCFACYCRTYILAGI